VAAVNPDSALFSSDFRAPERLFSLLLQAAGRAGRRTRRPPEAGPWRSPRPARPAAGRRAGTRRRPRPPPPSRQPTPRGSAPPRRRGAASASRAPRTRR
jgi:hypothetical protein